MGTKNDSRSNHLLLKTDGLLITNDAPPMDQRSALLRRSIAQSGHTSQEQTNSTRARSNKPMRAAKSNSGALASFAVLALLMIVCIGTQMKINSLNYETEQIQKSVRSTMADVKRRKEERMKRNVDREGYMHILDSYEVPIDSALAYEILAAYKQ